MEIKVSKIPGAELSSVIGQSRFTLKKVFSHKSDLMVQTFLLIQKETRAWIVLLSLLTKLHQDNPEHFYLSKEESKTYLNLIIFSVNCNECA